MPDRLTSVGLFELSEVGIVRLRKLVIVLEGVPVIEDLPDKLDGGLDIVKPELILASDPLVARLILERELANGTLMEGFAVVPMDDRIVEGRSVLKLDNASEVEA